MRTDAEVTAAAERTANAVVTLVGERNRARDLAARLEAENAALTARLERVAALIAPSYIRDAVSGARSECRVYFVRAPHLRAALDDEGDQP